jgi:hypothetical protein
VTLLELSIHHLHRDHGIVDQEAERNHEGAERDAVQVDAHQRQDENGGSEHQRDRQSDHDAGAPTKRDQRYDQHDADRLAEGLEKLVD